MTLAHQTSSGVLKESSSSTSSQALTSRTTLSLPQRKQRTLLDKYKGIAPSPPKDNPYRFIQRKLGFSMSEFEDKIDQEIDELFQEIEQERRQALLESLPLGCALTKADCRKLFPTPPSGSLIGVYNWAHDIDSTPSARDDSRPAHE